MEPIATLLEQARRRLQAAEHAAPPREAWLLLGYVLGWDEARVRARDDRTIEPEQAGRFADLVERRVRGEPVAYLTGEREFFGRSFSVDQRVLIPRPETEHLVEAALALALPASPSVLDIGTGSGCLGVTLALELEARRVLATDRSLGALSVARCNAARHDAGQVSGICTDWLAGVDPATLDLVVSNPPYISPADRGELSLEILDYEPEDALFASSSGLSAYREILRALKPLRPGTPVLFEIGLGQRQAVCALACDAGFTVADVIDDYAGIARVVVVNRGGD